MDIDFIGSREAEKARLSAGFSNQTIIHLLHRVSIRIYLVDLA